MQVKHKNTLNWMAKCTVTKTFPRHSNKLEMVSNNTQSASQLGRETKPIYYRPTNSDDQNFQYIHALLYMHEAHALYAVHARTQRRHSDFKRSQQ